MNHLALALLHSFTQAFSPESNPQAGAMEEVSGEHRHFERAKLYIRDNLSSPLQMAQVARELDISPRHLSRIFQVRLGQTFVHYIQERRIQQAKDLLLHTDLPIKDIAERCGFESVHYFTRVFTKQLGVSPPGSADCSLRTEGKTCSQTAKCPDCTKIRRPFQRKTQPYSLQWL